MPTVLWWGRFDPNYSRNRILRRLLPTLGWQVADFNPRLCSLGDWEARLRGLDKPDLIWVPCFRQRDFMAASRWAQKHKIPLLFDPLISAYDKQVYERRKYPPGSVKARRLLGWEKKLFRRADIVLADTQPHADYFIEEFELDPGKVKVVFVGAEEPLFHPAPMPDHRSGSPIEVLFYGSFIGLQAPQLIVEAARIYNGPPVQWILLGNGPLRTECEQFAKDLLNVRFENPIAYEKLPERIHRADILLGVFGAGAKAGRVIPNKVFQALACGRPVVTQCSEAYPPEVREGGSGLIWVEPGNAENLAQTIAHLSADSTGMFDAGRRSTLCYETYFSEAKLQAMLSQALRELHSPERA